MLVTIEEVLKMHPNNPLLRWDRLKPKKVLVVGDAMLDYYLWGKATRLSPEAPVPILKMGKGDLCLGGAGNVAFNLKELGCCITLVCGIGPDKDGEILANTACELLDKVAAMCVLTETTAKKRIMVSPYGHQLARMDWEDDSTCVESKLIWARCLEEAIKLHPDAVVISDYDKGMLRSQLGPKLIGYVQEQDIPIFIGSKDDSWQRYSGATCIVANKDETDKVITKASQKHVIAGDRTFIHNHRTLCENLGIKRLVVTQGSQGAELYGGPDHGSEPTIVPAFPQQVYDVCGAGDTFLAMLVLARLNGFAWPDATLLANYAASKVVGKVGTATVTLHELQESTAQ